MKEAKKNVKSFDCPLCGSKEYKKIKTFSDGVLVGKCKSCDLIYTPLRHNTPEDLFGEFSLERLKLIYEPLLNGSKNHFRINIFRKYLSTIKKYNKGNSLLDIGCAHGFYIDIAHKKGYKVSGVEPNATMAKFANQVLKHKVHVGTLDKVKLNNEKWDIICFTDSMEYFMSPIKDLRKLNENNLNEDGIIFIKVPNGDYFKFRHVLKNIGLSFGAAEPFSPSKRVIHFNYDTINMLSEKVGLKTIKRGYFEPIDSPLWKKHTGLYLETEAPWWLGLKNKILRKVTHYIGLIEFLIIKKNHFSQSVFIILKKT